MIRKRLALSLALGLAAAALSATTASAGQGGEDQGDNRGTHSPIKHTIVLFQENISFDHYFGTYGHGANGIPAGATLTHTSGGQSWGPYAPTRLNGQTQGFTCDVEHGYSKMIQMADHGAMDRYLQFGNDKIEPNPSTNGTCPAFESVPPPGSGVKALANGYYDGVAGNPTSPLQNYWQLASQYTLADNFFQGVYGPSTPGAEWLVAATNNTVHDPNPAGDTCNDYPAGISQQDIPNLGQEASANGVSWAWFQGGFGKCAGAATNGYSAHHDPFQYFTSTADLDHSHAYDPKLDYAQANLHQRDLDVLYAALGATAVAGQTVVPSLPAISWVKAPTAGDGHPSYSGPNQDDNFLGDLVARLKASAYWKDTALLVAFDETGGWWDHVSPPDLSSDPHFATWVNGSPNLSGCQYPGNADPCGEAGFGPRMPALIISPFARTGYVDHNLYDTSSLVKWVEWNHKLPPLGVWGNRDVNAGNLAHAFRFGTEQAAD